MHAKYLTLLAENELEQRVEKLEALLASCTVCPKDCGNDRLAGEIAACYSGRLPIVSSYTAHFGEEPLHAQIISLIKAMPQNVDTDLRNLHTSDTMRADAWDSLHADDPKVEQRLRSARASPTTRRPSETLQRIEQARFPLFRSER